MRQHIRALGTVTLLLLPGCGNDGTGSDGGPETTGETDAESDTNSTDDPSADTETETETDDETDDETEPDTDDETDDETEPDTDDESDTDDPPDLEGICGNGLLHVDEVCDDGNDVPGDGCEPDCTLSVNVEWVVVDPAPGYPCSEHQTAALSLDGDLLTAGPALMGNQAILRVDAWDRDTGESLGTFSSASGGMYLPLTEPIDIDVAADGSVFVANSGGFGGPDGQLRRFSSELELDWMVQDTTHTYYGVVAVDDGAIVVDGRGLLIRVGPDGNQIDSVQVPEQLLGSYGYWLADLSPAGDDVALLHAAYDDELSQNSVSVWHYDAATFELALPPWQWPAGNIVNARLKELIHHDGTTWVLGELPIDEEDPPHWAPILWGVGVGENTPSIERSFAELGHVHQDAWRGFAVRDDGVMVLALQHTLLALDADGKLLWHIDASNVDPNAAASANPTASSFADAVVDADGAMFVGSVTMPGFACSRVAWTGRVSW